MHRKTYVRLQLKTWTAHLVVRPRLKIGNRKVFEKGISFY
jgi:hypothetical protein